MKVILKEISLLNNNDHLIKTYLWKCPLQQIFLTLNKIIDKVILALQIHKLEARVLKSKGKLIFSKLHSKLKIEIQTELLIITSKMMKMK